MEVLQVLVLWEDISPSRACIAVRSNRMDRRKRAALYPDALGRLYIPGVEMIYSRPNRRLSIDEDGREPVGKRLRSKVEEHSRAIYSEQALKAWPLRRSSIAIFCDRYDAQDSALLRTLR